ncbi:hypothetical protein [Streptomyces aculeolatus]|uniref:hypothetical protein n=1 Tax=Streptomyces aculeolatus TaxID=270689 RepID=UPI001CEDBA29|nr:hypothetical protein [Streptomyces aculeolatus]
MTTCTICRTEYDETDEAAVKEHTEPVYCAETSKRCNRCNGRPRCYPCGSSFCFCSAH